MKRTPLKRGGPLRRTVGLTSTTPLKRYTPVNPVSQTRKDERPQRDACRAVVLARDPICRFPGCRRPSSEVHELHRGAGRHADYLDPEMCRGLCRECHQIVTDNPILAHDLGLSLWSWERMVLNHRGMALRTGETLDDLAVGTVALARELGAPE
jgi:hypothetical protein